MGYPLDLLDRLARHCLSLAVGGLLALCAGTAAAQKADPTEIDPPRQVRFVEAEYPKAAQEQRLEATVVLRLDIDAEGRVTKASVEHSAGPEFDEAARRAALGFVFEPARLRGEPVAARILYEYRFTLEPPPAEPPARQSPGAATPRARAIVELLTDSVPIVGATVLVHDAVGHTLRAQTNEQGRVVYSNLEPGTYRVEVAAPGYRPYVQEEQFAAGRETSLTYRLVPSTEAIEVLVHGEVQRDATVREISQEEFKLVPGGAGDPIRVVESLPGVARTSDGSLVIRGANPFFSGVLLDGMALPQLYHNYNIASVVPADLVDTVTLYPGNFGVQHGRYIGGLVDVTLQSPYTQCERRGKPVGRDGCAHGALDLNLIDGHLSLEAPVPRARGWSFAVSARRSWLDFLLKAVMKESGLQLEVAPRYFDGYSLVEYEDDDQKLSLRAYGSNDEIIALTDELGGVEDVTDVGRFQLEYGFERLQAVYSRKLGGDVTYESMLGLGRNRFTLYMDDFTVRERSWPFVFRHEVETPLLPRVDANVGLDFITSPYKLLVEVPPGEALTPVERYEIESTDATFGVYAELPVRPTERSAIVPGFRLDYTPSFEEATFDPRLLARYDLVKRPDRSWLRRTTVKAAAGLYHQAPPIVLRLVDDDVEVKSLRARQYSLGLEQEISAHLDWSLEGFFIDRDHLFSGRSNPDGSSAVENRGTGDTIGLESFLRFHSHDRFFGWFAYTLSRSMERTPPAEDRSPPNFDQTHHLILVASVDIGRGWRTGARFRYVTGNPFTDIVPSPFSPSLFDGGTGNYVGQYSAPNALRFPDVHELDLRVDKKWQYKHWALSTYLDVRNVYNHRIVDFYQYNYDYTERRAVQGLPILPSLGVRGEF